MKAPASVAGLEVMRRMLLCCALLMMAGIEFVSAMEVDPQLLPVGADWKFKVATSEPSSPITAWRELAFDDSGWLTGRSGFSQFADEVTALSTSNVASVYLRARFVVTDAASVKWLVLRMDYSDGFVAYLNGEEIARRGVTGTPPPFDAVAIPHPRAATQEMDVSDFTPWLAAGTNLLAIQLHSATVPATNLVVVPELCANFQRGPYLQDVGVDGSLILWRTPGPASTVVDYGTTPALGLSTTNITPLTNHEVRLTGLAPDTEWFYRIRGAAEATEAVSPVYSFRTLRSTGDVSFAVMGDSGSGRLPQLQVASVLSTAAVDLVLHVGDTAYWSLNPQNADQRLLSVYAPQMRRTPFFATVGNHDLNADSSTFFETFHPPTNNLTGTAHFYSFDHGNAHFVCLFVPTLAAFNGMAPYALAPGGAQLQWLTNDLAATTRPWRILFLHSPLLTSGPHRFDDWNNNGTADRLELQQWLLPVAAQYGAQVIFSGHDHCYERSAPVGGVECFVTGGGGMLLYGMAERDSLSQRFESRYHFLKASIHGEMLTIQAIDQFGVVFDNQVIPRSRPPHVLVSLLPASILRLRWNSVPGAGYSIEESDRPDGPYMAVSHPDLPLTADSYQTQFDLDMSGRNPADPHFFRIRVLPE